MQSGCEGAEPLFTEWREKFDNLPGLNNPKKAAEVSAEVFDHIPYRKFNDKLDNLCSPRRNKDIPDNNYDRMLEIGRSNVREVLFSNTYIVE